MSNKKKTDNYFMDLYENLFDYYSHEGLCLLVTRHIEIFNLLVPTGNDMADLRNEKLPQIYWAAGSFEEVHLYNTLRQTILLFCHEILNSQNHKTKKTWNK